ncbi:hypothetical protein Drorol1_Dr00008202 [Drosera rotundifolia]
MFPTRLSSNLAPQQHHKADFELISSSPIIEPKLKTEAGFMIRSGVRDAPIGLGLSSNHGSLLMDNECWAGPE